MQENRQEYAEAQQILGVSTGRTEQRRAERYTIDQGVKGQAEQYAAPVDLGHHLIAVALVHVLFHVVQVRLVKVQQAQQEQHGHQSEDHPGHHRVEAASSTQRQHRVWQEVEKRNTQHQPGHQTHGELGAGMSHLQSLGHTAAYQGNGHQRGAVEQQQDRRGHYRSTRLSR
jgi:hypothetical protein